MAAFCSSGLVGSLALALHAPADELPEMRGAARRFSSSSRELMDERVELELVLDGAHGPWSPCLMCAPAFYSAPPLFLRLSTAHLMTRYRTTPVMISTYSISSSLLISGRVERFSGPLPQRLRKRFPLGRCASAITFRILLTACLSRLCRISTGIFVTPGLMVWVSKIHGVLHAVLSGISVAWASECGSSTAYCKEDGLMGGCRVAPSTPQTPCACCSTPGQGRSRRRCRR